MAHVNNNRAVFCGNDWKQAQGPDGRVADWVSVLRHISEKGIKEPETKRELWPLLLLDPNASQQAAQGAVEACRSAYQQLLAVCKHTDAELLGRLSSVAQAHTRAQAPAAATQQQVQSMDDKVLEQPSTPRPSAGVAYAAAEDAATGEARQPGSELWRVPIASLGLSPELRRFYETQRMIVTDAIRTDFTKNSLTTVRAISSWVSSTLADSSMYQRLASSKDWEQGRDEQEWVSSLARHHLQQCTHLSSDQKVEVLRLVRLLSAYAMHDPETGYSQGMSDLALPFLLVMEDDALAFWCFERLMKKVQHNFAADASGILAQLMRLGSLIQELDQPLYARLRQLGADDCHFAYRMLVVQMRRELPLDQALRLWEILWADDLLEAMPNVAEEQRCILLQQMQQEAEQRQLLSRSQSVSAAGHAGNLTDGSTTGEMQEHSLPVGGPTHVASGFWESVLSSAARSSPAGNRGAAGATAAEVSATTAGVALVGQRRASAPLSLLSWGRFSRRFEANEAEENNDASHAPSTFNSAPQGSSSRLDVRVPVHPDTAADRHDPGVQPLSDGGATGIECQRAAAAACEAGAAPSELSQRPSQAPPQEASQVQVDAGPAAAGSSWAVRLFAAQAEGKQGVGGSSGDQDTSRCPCAAPVAHGGQGVESGQAVVKQSWASRLVASFKASRTASAVETVAEQGLEAAEEAAGGAAQVQTVPPLQHLSQAQLLQVLNHAPALMGAGDASASQVLVVQVIAAPAFMPVAMPDTITVQDTRCSVAQEAVVADALSPDTPDAAAAAALAADGTAAVDETVATVSTLSVSQDKASDEGVVSTALPVPGEVMMPDTPDAEIAALVSASEAAEAAGAVLVQKDTVTATTAAAKMTEAAAEVTGATQALMVPAALAKEQALSDAAWPDTPDAEKVEAATAETASTAVEMVLSEAAGKLPAEAADEVHATAMERTSVTVAEKVSVAAAEQLAIDLHGVVVHVTQSPRGLAARAQPSAPLKLRSGLAQVPHKGAAEHGLLCPGTPCQGDFVGIAAEAEQAALERQQQQEGQGQQVQEEEQLQPEQRQLCPEVRQRTTESCVPRLPDKHSHCGNGIRQEGHEPDCQEAQQQAMALQSEASGQGHSQVTEVVTQELPLHVGQTAEQQPCQAYGGDLLMYFLAAMVISQRQVLDQCADADDVLKHFQSGAQALRLDVLECAARAKRYRAQHQDQRKRTQPMQMAGLLVAGMAMSNP